ncbi:MAG: FAD-binding oxidoreductase [Actinomycetota bacterium]|nr:FAD-binding oxidoreductase [Actinomycetota bacterium]
MKTTDRGAGPADETVPGVARRKFLSVGGGLLAGAGTLGLARPGRSLAPATRTAPPVTGGLKPIFPDDPRYDTMRMGFNRRWVGAPAYIQIVENAEQTVRAVQLAVKTGRRITVRGGGHCYESFSSGNDGGVIIDLSGMQGVYQTPGGQVCVEGGATLFNVYETLFKDYNLTLPGGSCYSVGVGGHIAGGGYGLLSRQQGLVVDYLTGADVVCVNQQGEARLVRARKGDPKTGRLLWAHTGGGGGNFGIVTAYYFSGLPKPPEQVRVAISTWPWADLKEDGFRTLLRNFGRFMEANSSPSSPYAGLFALLHAFHVSAGKITMTTQAAGPAIGLLDTFLMHVNAGLAVPPAKAAITDLPWLQATQWLNGSGKNQRGKYKSAYMKAAFPEDQITAIYYALTDPGFVNPQALIQVDSYGCQVNAVAPDATAVAQRSSVMKLQYQTYWTLPAQDKDNLDWINSHYARVYAATGGVPVSNDVTDGCFINYCDVDLPPSWPTLYYKSGYPALQAVKARWDPRNVFNHAQSIVPA